MGPKYNQRVDGYCQVMYASTSPLRLYCHGAHYDDLHLSLLGRTVDCISFVRAYMTPSGTRKSNPHSGMG